MKIKIKKGDKVKILSGNYKNKKGEILKILKKQYKAIIKGINIIKKHIKPSSKNPKGKIEKKESPIHISNIILINNLKKKKNEHSETKREIS